MHPQKKKLTKVDGPNVIICRKLRFSDYIGLLSPLRSANKVITRYKIIRNGVMSAKNFPLFKLFPHLTVIVEI